MKNYINIYNNYKIKSSNLVAQISTYSWQDYFCQNEIEKLYKLLIKEFDDVDFTKFNVDELIQLDFQWFDEDLILMPVWVLDCLKNGCEIYSISGRLITFNKSVGLDRETRFGSTAYGFSKSQLRDFNINRILDTNL